jgi:hypothetical protein
VLAATLAFFALCCVGAFIFGVLGLRMISGG